MVIKISVRMYATALRDQWGHQGCSTAYCNSTVECLSLEIHGLGLSWKNVACL